MNFVDSEWEGLHKTMKLIRSDGQIVKLALYDDEVELTQECYVAGVAQLGFYGTSNETEPEEMKIASTDYILINFKEHAYDNQNGIAINEPTPSQWDIIIGQMNSVKDDIDAMKEELEGEVSEVENKLENGDFDGRGITSITKIAAVGLTDTYQINYTDNTTSTFDVINGENGIGITGIEKTGTSGLVDTYTITLTNGQTETFTVTNGANGIDGKDGKDGKDGTNGQNGVGIVSIAKTGTSGLVDTYTITLTNGETQTFTVTNGQNGTNGTNGVGIVSIEKTSTAGLVDTYTITLSDNSTYTFTVTNGQSGQDLEEEGVFFITVSDLLDLSSNSSQTFNDTDKAKFLDVVKFKVANPTLQPVIFLRNTVVGSSSSKTPLIVLATQYKYTSGNSIDLYTNYHFTASSALNRLYQYRLVLHFTINNGEVTSIYSATLYRDARITVEDTTNKTTTISSSSTDTQYPSALAVYNYVESQITQAIGGAY